MKENNNGLRTIDYKFSDLCEEIDQWKDEAKYWKKMYNEELERSNKAMNESLEMSRQGVANALMLALRVDEDEEGNLIIPKERRTELAKNYEKD